MKVLLIEPPRVAPEGNLRIYGSMGAYKSAYVWPPLDLMVIAGYLHSNGIESDIIDCNARNLTFEQLDNEIKSPDLVVFTTSATTLDSDMKVAQLAFKHGAKSIAVGSAVGLPEPERFVLLAALGMTPKNEKVMDLDELGISAHEKLDLRLYKDPFAKKNPFSITYYTRGCRWAHCSYCSCPHFFRPMRARSIDRMMSELRWMEHKGIHDFKFFDAMFNQADSDALVKEMARSELNLGWQCLARVDDLPLARLEAWHKAGCHTVHIGVESASPNILHRVRKGITNQWVERAVANIRKAGMSPVTYFMFGLPGETKETMKQTLDFAIELNPDATTFSIASPHPGTDFHHLLKSKGYLKDGPCNPSDRPSYSYPDLTADEIYRMTIDAYRKFYLRPSFMLRSALKIRSMGQLKSRINALKMLK